MIILSTDGIDDSAKNLLESAGHTFLDHKIAQEQLAQFLAENKIEGLLVRSRTKVTKEIIDACPTLKLIGRAGVGLDNIDVAYAKEKGIAVLNTPNASSRSVAEMVFAHLFSLARNLHESNRLMPLEGETRFELLKKSLSSGRELLGATLGVIGFGSIGMEVAKIGLSLGMKVKVCTRTPITKTIDLSFFDGQKVSFQLSSTNDMKAFLSDLDYLSINTPKTSEYVISEKEFAWMKPGIFIVNTARGGVLDEVALLNAIDEEIVLGAALDVFESEPKPEVTILMNPALSLSPHLGGSTLQAQERIGLELAGEVLKYEKII